MAVLIELVSRGAVGPSFVDLPVFIVRVKDDAGNVTERKYKLNTPIVRRVLAPGEQKESSVVSHRSSARAKKKKR